MQNRTSRTKQIRLIIAQMMSFTKKPMSNQATGIKLRGQRRLMTFDVSETIVLSTRSWLKASHGRTLRSTVRKSSKSTSRSRKEAQSEVAMSNPLGERMLEEATSTDKKALPLQSKRTNQMPLVWRTQIGQARRPPSHQRLTRARIEARRNSTRLR